jgi:hypothetical protein
MWRPKLSIFMPHVRRWGQRGVKGSDGDAALHLVGTKKQTPTKKFRLKGKWAEVSGWRGGAMQKSPIVRPPRWNAIVKPAVARDAGPAGGGVIFVETV